MEIELSKIKVEDSFLSRYCDLIKTKVLPYQWKILSDTLDQAAPSYVLENFKIAAHLKTGDFHGVVFQDSDLAKWLEAVAYVIAAETDTKLEDQADQVIELIEKAQWEDGYLDTYYTIHDPQHRWSNLLEGHELYVAGHMIEAGVAYFKSTGKDKLLWIVCKMADLICETFGMGEEQCHGYPGHQEIELALIKLYRITGIKRYLEQAKYFIDIRGVGNNYFLEEKKQEGHKQIFPEFTHYDPIYSQSHLPVRQQKTAEGHAVRATYMYSAMADLAFLYQDKELEECCQTIWNNMTQKRLYITGGIGSSGILERFTTDYDLPNDCNYSETCASIGLIMFASRMAALKKERVYIDVLESCLYNNVLAGISLDGTRFFYVNPLEVWPSNCMNRTSKEHVMPVRQPWFGVACCPPNIARLLASVGQYIYMTDVHRLYINLFIANHSEITVGSSVYSIHISGNYPNSGRVKIHIHRVSQDKWEKNQFAIRIPGYIERYHIYVNQEERKEKDNLTGGYLILEDTEEEINIQLDFDLSARFIHANPEVRADSGKVAIMKGPLVYCLEETDNMENLSALYIDTKQKMEEQYNPDLLGGVTQIELKGKRITKEGWDECTLYQTIPVTLEETSLLAVPYGSWGNRKTGEMIVWIKELI